MRVALIGSNGKVGRLLQSLLSGSENELFVKIEANVDYNAIEARLKKCDVVIDFSTPTGLEHFLDEATVRGVRIPLVTGTTGLSKFIKDKLEIYSKEAPVLVESNMSIGANILFLITQEVSKILSKDLNFVAKILDVHHVHKKDSPSGTAITLFDIIKKHSNLIKSKEESIESKREGEVVGYHSVKFISNGEEIEVNHLAKDRIIFAKGAIVAAQMIQGRGPGIYGMKDVLL